jgi:hypothetical protein
MAKVLFIGVLCAASTIIFHPSLNALITKRGHTIHTHAATYVPERSFGGSHIDIAPVAVKPPPQPLSMTKVKILGHAFKMMMMDETTSPTKSKGTSIVTYRIGVQKGLEKEAEAFSATVERVLNHPNGWATAGLHFVQTHNEKASMTILLVKPDSIDAMCDPLPTGGRLSCAIYRRANLNYLRWTEGARTFGKDLETYRSYLINHEVGHLLGMRHETCAKSGQKASVMLQQTKFLKGCTANGQPTPKELAKLSARFNR